MRINRYGARYTFIHKSTHIHSEGRTHTQTHTLRHSISMKVLSCLQQNKQTRASPPVFICNMLVSMTAVKNKTFALMDQDSMSSEHKKAIETFAFAICNGH